MIEQFIQALLPSFEHFHSLAYWVAFVAAFAETTLVVGLLVPGSTLLLLLGALSATGQIDFAGIFWFGKPVGKPGTEGKRGKRGQEKGVRKKGSGKRGQIRMALS